MTADDEEMHINTHTHTDEWVSTCVYMYLLEGQKGASQMKKVTMDTPPEENKQNPRVFSNFF